MTRIRSFENDDIGAITNMVSLGYPFEPGQTPEQTVKEEINNCDVWVYDDGSLKGISSVRGSYGGNDSVLIKLYTHPNERGNGNRFLSLEPNP
ncbi:hypothetical protein [Alicyclobacillus fodiniaquatilis]|uniref:Uncharacterized protein n=1 Tax=Alicyclobacillus fodiniaquatilis TaxID=1661150 RepID=A0ABW4JMU3_9BACL